MLLPGFNMKSFIFLFTIFCFICSFDSSKFNSPTIQEKISGSIVDGRYYTEDKSFSVNAESLLYPSIKIIERQSDSLRTVIFESTIGGPTIRYDVFPIEDDKAFINLCLDSDCQKGFLEFFYHKAISPRFMREDVHVLEIANEEIISKDGWNYHIVILKGPTSISYRNLATGEQSEDYIGALLSIKGRNLVAITYQKGLTPLNDLAAAKEELIPKMMHFFDNFLAEDLQNCEAY